MKSRKWIILAISLVLVLITLLPACSTETTATPTATPTATAKPTLEPRDGGIMKIVTNASLSQIGYIPLVTGAMSGFVDMCLEPLLVADTLTGKYYPVLAESWEVDPNGKFVTFNLRHGVKFHDGTNFNAQAVKDFLIMKQGAMKGWLSNMTSIDVVSEYVVKLNMAYMDLLTMSSLSEWLGSPTFCAKGPDAIAYEPVGTGPFKFVEYKRDVILKYTRNDDYWGYKPHLDGIEWLFVPDTESMVAALLAGEAHRISDVQFKDIDKLKAAGFNLVPIPSIYNGFVGDTIHPDSPLANRKVLQAIEYAIDRKTICDQLGAGYLHANDLLIPYSVAGYTPGLGREYNPQKAKDLLAEAGYSGGLDITITISPFAIKETIEAIQSDLAKVGITATIDLADNARFTDLEKKGWNNSLMYVHGMYGMPFEYYLHRTWAKMRADWVSVARPAGFEDMIDDMVKDLDTASRLAKLQKLALMVRDDSMYIPFLSKEVIQAISPKLHDYGTYKHNLTREFYQMYNVWLSE